MVKAISASNSEGQMEALKKMSESSPFSSMDNFIDFAIYATVNYLGVYCIFILSMVCYLIKIQSSLIEYNTDPMAAKMGYPIQRYRSLTFEEWLE